MSDNECTVANVDLDEVNITVALHALADPVRLDMVRQLANCGTGEMCCGELNISVSKSTTTHHLRILTKAGLVLERSEGTRKHLSLRRTEFDNKFPGLLQSILAAK